MNEQARGFPAVRWGLTFGIVLVIAVLLPFVWVWTNTFHLAPNASPTLADFERVGLALWTFCGSAIVVSLLSFFFAGFLTARDTGRWRSGAFAAALACIAFIMVSFLVFSVVLRISAASLFAGLANASLQLHASVAFASAFSTVFILLIGVLFAAGTGALGALLGCAIFGRASYS